MKWTCTTQIFNDERFAPYVGCALVKHTNGKLGWLVKGNPLSNRPVLIHTLAEHKPVRWLMKDVKIITTNSSYSK